MVINISFINKNVTFTNCKNSKILEDLKQIFSRKESLKAENQVGEEKNQTENSAVEKFISNQDDSTNLENDETELVSEEKNAEKFVLEKENVIKIAERNFDLSLEEFIKEISNNQEIFSTQFLNSIKLDKKFLILPDELVSYDSVTLPALKPWKMGEALKIKLSVDYKDFGAYNFSYKNILKSKTSSSFAIQLVNQKQVNKLLNVFRKYGLKASGVNFYSSVLASFYISHIALPKFGSVLVRLDKNHATIMAISHGFLVSSFSVACGYEDILAGSPYRMDEFSKKMTSYKYICYELSNRSGEENKKHEDLSLEKIEKAFPTARTNLLAPVFQVRNASSKEVIKQKISEMVEFLKQLDFHFNTDKIIIDTESQEAFDILKIKNSIKVSFSESEIFAKAKQNQLLKIKKVGFLGRLKCLFKKKKK